MPLSLYPAVRAGDGQEEMKMKIDRLIGILSILLQKELVTAPELAQIFEVSRRTINRDIDALCRAGIPLATRQGQNGGISIMSGYRMDRTILTSSEMQSILAGLKSLDSVAGTSRYQQLMKKLSFSETSVQTADSHIYINLSSWHKSSLPPKIELIREAIDTCHLIQFQYYAPAGETKRRLEPYLLVFQWASWYVWGYCLERKAYRMFKLNRMQELKLAESFSKREVPCFDPATMEPFPSQFQATAVCAPEMKWRLIEEYGRESFEERPDGSLLFRAGFSDKDHLFGWLLSMGSQIELLKPEKYRKELKELIEEIYKKYNRKKEGD